MKALIPAVLSGVLAGGSIVATLALTPFHPKIDQDVQIVLSADVMSATGKVYDAWSGLQDEFNSLNLAPAKVHIFWDNKDVVTKIMSQYQLPDLYLTRAQSLPTYTASGAKDKMRNFDQYQEYYAPDFDAKKGVTLENKETSLLKTPRLLSEYTYKDKLLGIPLYKSFECAVVNTTQIPQVWNDKIAVDKNFLYHLSYNDITDLIKASDERVPVYGFDDPASQMLLNERDGQIDVDAYNAPDNFVYKLEDMNLNQNFNLKFNLNEKYFDDYIDPWRQSGRFITSSIEKGRKLYTSTEFQKGKMVLSGGSSAGLWGYTPNALDKDGNTILGKDGKPTKVDPKKLVVIPNPTMYGKNNRYFSQGIGIGGFKSTGKNKTAKEQTVDEFLKWLLIGNHDVKQTNGKINNERVLHTLAGKAYYYPAVDPKGFPLSGLWSQLYQTPNLLEDSVLVTANPGDSLFRNTLSNLWVNKYWGNKDVIPAWRDIFNYDSFKQYTTFSDLFNRSRVVE